VDTESRRNHSGRDYRKVRQLLVRRKKSMRKLILLLLTVVGIVMCAVPALAQPETPAAAAANNSVGLKAIAAGIGFAIAVFGGALGQSRVGAAACEGAARNPGAAGKIQTMMILALALIESLVLFALLIVFVKT
jgi:F-type H+-transporting ATPase subunit c